jgi:hypothetical protein
MRDANRSGTCVSAVTQSAGQCVPQIPHWFAVLRPDDPNRKISAPSRGRLGNRWTDSTGRPTVPTAAVLNSRERQLRDKIAKLRKLPE